jgi:hypothetical protein
MSRGFARLGVVQHGGRAYSASAFTSLFAAGAR